MDALVLRWRSGWGQHPAQASAVKVRPNLLAGEDSPPQPLQPRSQHKRARLKAAGLALFGEKGYEQTSINDVARRAKVAVGGFYQHFRSKRQLLLALMDDLLENMGRLNLRPSATGNVQAGLRELLARGFSGDLQYLGACRAWEEAVLSDPELARKQQKIRAWTTSRIEALFRHLAQLPGARRGIDHAALARVIDGFFWSLLAQAVRMPRVELNDWIDSATHMIYHALFRDRVSKRSVR
jgi:AcrR family transcriptional regulator